MPRRHDSDDVRKTVNDFEFRIRDRIRAALFSVDSFGIIFRAAKPVSSWRTTGIPAERKPNMFQAIVQM